MPFESCHPVKALQANQEQPANPFPYVPPELPPIFPGGPHEDANEISMLSIQQRVVDIQRDLMMRLSNIVTLEVKDTSGDYYMFSLYKPLKHDPNKVFIGRSGSARYKQLPFDVFGDHLFIPKFQDTRIVFNYTCFSNSKSFLDICHCAFHYGGDTNT